MPTIKRALLSAYDKAGLADLAAKLSERGVELWASAGTAKFLAENKIKAQPLETLTGFEELLGGRVKTLHPAVFAGILARETEDDAAELAKAGYPAFDLVYVNLYPFPRALGSCTEAELVELVDIGGVSLLRAAAKNFERVVPCFSLEMLGRVLDEMGEDNVVPEELARQFAAETFFYTAAYDAAIAGWLWDGEEFPKSFAAGGYAEGMPQLRYGENPHQRAALYATTPPEGVPRAEVLGGKALSYNNILDLDAAYRGAVEFEEPCCVIVKHTSPCGIAIGDDIVDAYTKALSSDPISAFGGIIAVNRSVSPELAELVRKHFFECIIAPEYDPEALETLRKRKSLRILRLPNFAPTSRLSHRGIAGGVLVQEIDPPGVVAAKWEVVTERAPTPAQELELCFAMRAAKLVKSNSVVIARGGATVGIGGGLPSRVDAAVVAVRKAGDRAKGAVAASDAFMPFPDTLYVLAQAGVEAVVQPGGSKNDEAVIDAANRLGVAMVFTAMRHFRH